jgi:hypothetical protein
MDKQFLDFYGPIIVALIGGMSTLAAAFIGRPRSAIKPGSPNRILFLFGGLAALSFLIFAILIFSTWAPKDRLVQWKKEVEQHLGACTQDHSSCLRETIVKYPPPPQGPGASADFYEDMHMGALLMEIPRARETLGSLLGIGAETFTGSGYSIPWKSTYAQARAREYLIPNLPETDENVWTWQLEPAFANYKRSVQEILTLPPTDESNQRDLGMYLDEIIDQMKNSEVVSPVIRFQQFSKTEYSGRLGRREAIRVFAVNLRDVWEMTVEQAAASTGYPLSLHDAMDAKLFIWLFVPEHADAVIRATWGNIMHWLPKWLDKK